MMPFGNADWLMVNFLQRNFDIWPARQLGFRQGKGAFAAKTSINNDLA
jgi:hypothetical protein